MGVFTTREVSWPSDHLCLFAQDSQNIFPHISNSSKQAATCGGCVFIHIRVTEHNHSTVEATSTEHRRSQTPFLIAEHFLKEIWAIKSVNT